MKDKHFTLVRANASLFVSLKQVWLAFVSGIFKNEGPFDVYIDIREVKDLYEIKVSEHVSF